MANVFQFLRGLAANRTSQTPAAGEPLWVTDDKVLYVGDGTTAGGIKVSGPPVTSPGSGNEVAVVVSNGSITFIPTPPSSGQWLTHSGNPGGASWDPVVSGNAGNVITGDLGTGKVFWDGDYADLINTPTIITDHGALTGLADNDHPQYAQKAAVETITQQWTFDLGAVIQSPASTDGGFVLQLQSENGTSASMIFEAPGNTASIPWVINASTGLTLEGLNTPALEIDTSGDLTAPTGNMHFEQAGGPFGTGDAITFGDAAGDYGQLFSFSASRKGDLTYYGPINHSTIFRVIPRVTSPTAQFEFFGTDYFNDTANWHNFKIVSGATYSFETDGIGTEAPGNPMVFQVGGAATNPNQLYLSGDGKIGVGTGTVDASAGRMEIVSEGPNDQVFLTNYEGSASTGAVLRFRRARGTESLPADLVDGDLGANIKSFHREAGAFTVGAQWRIKHYMNGATVSGRHEFCVDGSSVAMVVNYDSNVGIGTDIPDQPLTVAGNLQGYGIHVDSTSGAGIEIDRGTSANAHGVLFQTAGVDDWYIGNFNESGLKIKSGNFSGTDIASFSTGNITFTSTTIDGNIYRADELRSLGGNFLVINSGESHAYATGQTGELIYLNAESGLQINSSPDNWVGGWAARNTATICDANGNSSLPGTLSVDGSGVLRGVTGNYGSIEIDGGNTGGYEGYSIGGRMVFMHNNSSIGGIYNDVNNQWILQSTLNGATKLYNAGLQKLTTTSGGVDITGNSQFTGYVEATGGITFDLTAQTTLDYYEEGTWTPQIWDSSNSNSETQTYTAQVGHYTRVGNVVHINAQININSLGNLTTTQQVRIGNLPFSVAATGNGFQRGSIFASFGASLSMTAGTSITGLTNSTEDSFRLYYWNSAQGSPNFFTIANLSAGGNLYINGHYHTDA